VHTKGVTSAVVAKRRLRAWTPQMDSRFRGNDGNRWRSTRNSEYPHALRPRAAFVMLPRDPRRPSAVIRGAVESCPAAVRGPQVVLACARADLAGRPAQRRAVGVRQPAGADRRLARRDRWLCVQPVPALPGSDPADLSERVGYRRRYPNAVALQQAAAYVFVIGESADPASGRLLRRARDGRRLDRGPRRTQRERAARADRAQPQERQHRSRDRRQRSDSARRPQHQGLDRLYRSRARS